MAANSHQAIGDVSCRTTGYTIQFYKRNKLPLERLTKDLPYTLEDLQDHLAFLSWDDYLIFLNNSHKDLPPDIFVQLCTSYKGSPHLRPLLTAAGLWFHPARYFEWAAKPGNGALTQLFRCVSTQFRKINEREVLIEEVLQPGFTLPPDIFWEAQAIGFSALTTYFGLGASIVTWERIDRGVVFRVQLPRRRPLRFLLSKFASWFALDTAEDVRTALSYGHERSIRLEKEITERKQAEVARQKSDQRFQNICNAVPGVVYQYFQEADGRQGFLFVSSGSTSMVGYTPEEIMTNPEFVWQGIEPEYRESFSKSVQISATHGTPWELEFQFRTKYGEIRWLRGRSIPDPSAENGRVVWNGILTDITAEKQADEQLRNRDALLRKLSEQVPGFLYQYQQWPDGRSCFPYASEGIRNIYEVSPQEVRETATSVFGRLHPDDSEAVGRSIMQSVETLQPWRYDYRVCLPEQGTRWLDGHATPERLQDGSTIWHGYIRDMTERKLAEESIRESENRFRSLIEDLEVGVVLQDESDRILVINATAARILGLTKEQLLGVTSMDPCWDLVREDGSILPHDDVPSVLAARSRQTIRNAVLGIRNLQTQERTWIQVSAIPQFKSDGALRHILVSLVDITERKRAEQALRINTRRLELAFAATSDAIWEWNYLTGETYYSPRWYEMLGCDPARPMSFQTWKELCHPDDFQPTVDRIREVLYQPNAIRYEAEFRMKHADGTWIWILGRGNIVERTPDGQPRLLAGTNTDITERKRAEEALRKSEARLSAVIGHAPTVAIQWYDINGVVKLWNDASEMMFGYPASEALGHSLDQLIFTPEEFANFRRALAKIRRTGLPSEPFEYSFRKRDGSIGVSLSTLFQIPGDELGDWFVCMDVDITPRKRVEEALQRSEERFRRLIENGHDVVAMYDRTGKILYQSPSVLRVLGYEPAELIGTLAMDLCHPDDLPAAMANQAQVMSNNAQAIPVELRCRCKDGSYRWLEFVGTNLLDEPSIGALVGNYRDVTERKLAQEALRENELRYRTLFETSSDAIFLLDLSGRILSANPAAARMHGYTVDELLNMRIQDLDLPDDVSKLPERMQKLKNGESITFEGYHRRKDGSTFPVEVISSAVQIGDSWYVIGFDRDITERKRSEAEIRESEQRLRVALTAATVVAFVWDIHTDSVTRYFSTEPALPANTNQPEPVSAVRSMVHPDDLERFDAGVAACLAQGPEYRSLYRVVRNDGTVRWLEEWGTLSRYPDGAPEKLTGISIDVTERKLSEAALQLAERRQRLALDAARMGTWDWEIGSDRLTWDEREQRLFGFEPNEYDGRVDTFLGRIHPEDLPGVRQVLADAAIGKDFDGEFRIRLPDGTVRWIHGTGTVIPKSDHSPHRLVGINYDITERKADEQALLEEKSLLQALFGSLPGIAFAIDRQGRYVRWNQNYKKLLGWSDDDMGQMTARQTVAIPDRERVTVLIEEIFTRGEAATELRALGKNGRELPLYCSGVRVSLGGEPCIVGFGIDITDRLQAEAALRESEERLRIFVESAPVGVAMLDREMRYLSHSRRWVRDYGLDERDLIGKSHYEIFPEVTDRWKQIHDRCLTGIAERCEQDRFERLDGSIDYLRWEIQPWRDAEGSVGGLVFFTELITDRVLAEDVIRSSLREKEAMLKEIHHRVKNNLQVISSLLSLQAGRVTHPHAADVLAESQNRVRAMALVHETLYRSDDLARVDLSRYLGELCGYLFRSYGVDSSRVRLNIDVESVTVSLDKTIPCGLLVNEIVSNSLKYAFPGDRSGTVTVQAYIHSDGNLTLTLADNGIGLPADLPIDRSATLGLQLVILLTEQLGGTLHVERSPGTRFVISFAP